ncbi:MAG: hypothetical protein RLZZ458_2026 [Planctomycetota bacterium]
MLVGQPGSGMLLFLSSVLLLPVTQESVVPPQNAANGDEPIAVELQSEQQATAATASDNTPEPAEAVAPTNPEERAYNCVRLPAFARQGTVQIDGQISESIWSLAPWSEDFVDIEGAVKPRPTYRTRMKMLWDSQMLYIAAELQDPDVRATLSTRDSVIFRDNDFEVFLDPEGDQLNYGELEINALNTIWDLRLPRPYSAGGQPDDGWTLQGLRSAVWVDGKLNDSSVPDRGWTLEMAIPWAGLRSLQDSKQPIRRAVRDGAKVRGYEIVADDAATATAIPATDSPVKAMPPTEGDVWRMNFSRVQWPSATVAVGNEQSGQRREENWVWSPQGTIDMHKPERWGRVVFSGPPEMENSGRGPNRIIRR